MKFKTQTRTEQVLTVMNILAWVAFIGFAIEGGAVLTSYVVSCIDSEAAKNIYNGLNLYNLRQFNFWHYTLHISFMILLSALKSYVWYLVIKTLSHLKLENPFKMETAQKLEKISYTLLATWIAGMTSSAHTAWLMKVTNEVHGNYVSGEFIFMAGLVFIISQVFKRGVEIQSENELTV
jgi:hypothetical protein